ncbi:unnamed protein product [Moneuplotes crassus]|uniref:Uncharacterized protein n=1 Tax=Euplotes crassus TaxID=5936 RepID=A0AAD1XPM8_EUPCR|nr:unnamed protein product [Moneuplotes crassus]
MGCSNARTIKVQANVTKFPDQKQPLGENKPSEKKWWNLVNENRGLDRREKKENNVQDNPGWANQFSKPPELSKDALFGRAKSPLKQLKFEKNKFLKDATNMGSEDPMRNTNELIRRNQNKSNRDIDDVRKGIDQLNDLFGSKDFSMNPNDMDKSGDINALLNDLVTSQDRKLYKFRENGGEVKNSSTLNILDGNIEGSGLIQFDHELYSNMDQSYKINLSSKEGSALGFQVSQSGFGNTLTAKNHHTTVKRNVSPNITSFDFSSKQQDTNQDEHRNYEDDLDRLLS